jgi:hypothetical protein
MAYFLAGVRSVLRRLGNDGALANVSAQLAAAAEAHAEVEQLVWRVAVADRAATHRPPTPATPHAA